ncbi:hypothetical protein BE08_20625 [Sorangium cellulosum]|uniref:Uncharacterized protein n=1 Tax=Sorangium cellulosum TaxID=56 RepID=A0A150P9U6_SORCE|nr:hypothetical protein BE08_20625 [Sorangium cellulosum]
MPKPALLDRIAHDVELYAQRGAELPQNLGRALPGHGETMKTCAVRQSPTCAGGAPRRSLAARAGRALW